MLNSILRIIISPIMTEASVRTARPPGPYPESFTCHIIFTYVGSAQEPAKANGPTGQTVDKTPYTTGTIFLDVNGGKLSPKDFDVTVESDLESDPSSFQGSNDGTTVTFFDTGSASSKQVTFAVSDQPGYTQSYGNDCSYDSSINAIDLSGVGDHFECHISMEQSGTVSALDKATDLVLKHTAQISFQVKGGPLKAEDFSIGISSNNGQVSQIQYQVVKMELLSNFMDQKMNLRLGI